jgi:hypothetical protein
MRNSNNATNFINQADGAFERKVGLQYTTDAIPSKIGNASQV